MFFLTRIRRWWRDRSRYIFRYDDGVNIRYADPIEIGTTLERELPDYADLLDVLSQNIIEVPAGPVRDNLKQQQHDAIKKLAAAARIAFRLPKLDAATGWGATDSHAAKVIGEYFVYMERLARKAEVFQDSPGVESVSHPA